ncbi:MAG: oligopeptide:H+ symporter [Pirellulaceae bacterium]|nr:oligopeptide:H+ symporter [Pirellulaceae bacterium]
MSSQQPANFQTETVFGHPAGLFTLFFAEMWERFCYYGMRAILVFYMLKGFLGLVDSDAYTIYGAYTALVYMTPFFGGMLADRILGKRRAVILGGLLMATGQGIMMLPNSTAFFMGLGLMIVGNGFFKPNISTMVGTLYPPFSGKRDAGFTIFYMGINLGAAMSPLLCGYVGETIGWHFGFGLATAGMLLGLVTFFAPRPVALLLVGLGSLIGVYALVRFQPGDFFSMAVNYFIAAALLVSASAALFAINRGGLPSWAGQPPDLERLKKPMFGLPTSWVVYIGAVLSAPIFACLVSGFAILPSVKNSVSVVSSSYTNSLASSESFHGALDAISKYSASPDEEEINEFLGGLAGKVEDKKLTDFHLEELESLGQKLLAGELDVSTRVNQLKKENPVNNFSVVFATLLKESSKPAGLVLMLCGLGALLYLAINIFQLPQIPRQRMYVVMILTFFSLLFWSFFEQAGSSINNFTDRNVDRVFETSRVSEAEIGQTVKLRIDPAELNSELNKLPLLSQEFLGRTNSDPEMQSVIANAVRFVEQDKNRNRPDEEKMSSEDIEKMLKKLSRDSRLTMTELTYLREAIKTKRINRSAYQDSDVPLFVNWTFAADNLGMGIGGAEMLPTAAQAFNPIFILILGLVFSGLWGFLAARDIEPNTPVKFSLGLILLGLGFGALWQGALSANEHGMVGLWWLVLAYFLHTAGELCLSPVGLSMVVGLSPARLVSTVMGTWFLATAFSQFLAAVIAQFTGVSDSSGGGNFVPVPKETIGTYGSVFQFITLAAIACGLFCLILSPILKRWMHEGAEVPEE